MVSSSNFMSVAKSTVFEWEGHVKNTRETRNTLEKFVRKAIDGAFTSKRTEAIALVAKFLRSLFHVNYSFSPHTFVVETS